MGVCGHQVFYSVPAILAPSSGGAKSFDLWLLVDAVVAAQADARSKTGSF